MGMKSQNEAILKHLKDGHSLTPLEALSKFNCFRLGARVYELKQQGHNISTKTVQNNGKRFAEYRLVNG